MSQPRKLPGHARARLHRQLVHGWQRAVFASPRDPAGSREEEVVPGPGPLSDDDAAAFERAFADLLERAEQASSAGRVKQTFVIDDRRRLELDARHGQIKAKTLDEAKVDKIMGGKDRELRPDRSGALLRAIGIMNPDGTISARNAKKYKQVNHLVELCRPTWEQVAGLRTIHESEPLRVVDLACGNSYLGLVLMEALRLADVPARLLGIDRRDDVIVNSRVRAGEVGLGERCRFVASSLEELEPAALVCEAEGRIDLALALHACDTATDAALSLAIRAGATAILAVPCCQAELARQLGGRLGETLVPAMVEQGLLRRELGALLTDSLRIEMLQACGYSVSVVEFVDAAHTPKNLLIRGHRRHTGPAEPSRWRLDAVAERCERLAVDPALLRLLRVGAPG